ncbi:MAG: helix-turn-helix domain-containing protein [Planctomycetota bacterium]|nr:helix-turn-helix domain-containing protein [Planctomycetota bacterium]
MHPPAQRLAEFLRARMHTLGIKSQAVFASRLGLGLTKLNGWLRAKGKLPNAKDWTRLEEKLGADEPFAAVRELCKPKPRRRPCRFKGFMHGDGI